MANLLVIDDEQAICWGLRQIAQQLGHTVETCSSAEDGLALSYRPDLIVLDVRLPGMDGLTAIDHFRRQFGELPIIVMTAFDDPLTARMAHLKGAFEFLVKPFDLRQFQLLLTRALDELRRPRAQAS